MYSPVLSPQRYERAIGSARLWTRENMENFIRYLSASVKNEENRITSNIYNDSVKHGLINWQHSQFMESDLIFMMELISLNNQLAEKPRIDSTIFMKATTQQLLESTTRETLNIRIIARSNMDQWSRSHMMKIYS